MIDSFVAVDIETTGLRPAEDKIIEIGAVKVVKGQVRDKFSELINPGIQLPEHIVSLTSITDTMLVGAKSEAEVLEQFLDFVGRNILLGHNIKFDYSFIKEALSKKNIVYDNLGIDTLYLARILHSELGSRSLASMCQYYGIVNPSAHRAYEDAKASNDLYFRLMGEFEGKKPELFQPRPLIYKIKKKEPISQKQKKYLLDLWKYHKMETQDVDILTKSEASRLIDKIILNHGRIQ